MTQSDAKITRTKVRRLCRCSRHLAKEPRVSCEPARSVSACAVLQIFKHLFSLFRWSFENPHADFTSSYPLTSTTVCPPPRRRVCSASSLFESERARRLYTRMFPRGNFMTGTSRLLEFSLSLSSVTWMRVSLIRRAIISRHK